MVVILGSLRNHGEELALMKVIDRFYENLGVHWTLTILGIISAVMVPVPYLFYIYGPTIRGWSKYAVIA
jgi:hypothetical protein